MQYFRGMSFKDKIRVYWRFIRFGFFTFTIVARVLFNAFINKKPLEKGMDIRQEWANKAISGIYKFRVEKKGKMPEGQHLFVSNHRSSIDPIVLLQNVRASPVSRADVEHYPLVGKGSKATGIIFVDKENRKSRAATIEAIGEGMKRGESVILFPEGRTHAEDLTIRFHIGSFRIACENNVPIFPMAIDYKVREDYWTHEEKFLVHFNKQFGRRDETFCKVRFGISIPPSTPEEMMETAQKWINQQIIEMRAEW